MKVWPVQEAKARFSEFLDTCLDEGPQVVTRRGVEAAVLVPIDTWKRLHDPGRPTIKSLLLGPGPRFDLEFPPRGSYRHRKPSALA